MKDSTTAPAYTTGYRAPAYTTGNWAPAYTTGYWAPAYTTGNGAPAIATGNGAPAYTTGNGAPAIAVAPLGSAHAANAGAIGRWVCLGPNTPYAVVMPEDGYIPTVITLEEGWPVDTWITMRDGHVVCDESVLLPYDGRGYTLTFVDGHYVTGCRRFTAEQALKHWANPKHPAPVSAALLLQGVERHIRRTNEGGGAS